MAARRVVGAIAGIIAAWAGFAGAPALGTTHGEPWETLQHYAEQLRAAPHEALRDASRELENIRRARDLARLAGNDALANRLDALFADQQEAVFTLRSHVLTFEQLQRQAIHQSDDSTGDVAGVSEGAGVERSARGVVADTDDKNRGTEIAVVALWTVALLAVAVVAYAVLQLVRLSS